MKRSATLLFLLTIFITSLTAQEINPEQLVGKWILEKRELVDPYKIAETLGMKEDEIFTARVGAWLEIRKDNTLSALEYDAEENPPEYVINCKYSTSGNKLKIYDVDKDDYIGWTYSIIELTDDTLVLEADILSLFQARMKYKRESSGVLAPDADPSSDVEIYLLNGILVHKGRYSEANLENGRVYIIKRGSSTEKIRF